jgi:predicted DCC family thiol-disulfide oxidoreductase YuxK
MKRLTVLYDAGCRLCRSARLWLEAERQLVPLEFIAAGSPEARRCFPHLDPGDTLADLTVVSDAGEVWRGAKAWVVCLWALAEHRERAFALATPELWPLARRFIAWISQRRHRLGRLLPAERPSRCEGSPT